jgi:hypothetical protein
VALPIDWAKKEKRSEIGHQPKFIALKFSFRVLHILGLEISPIWRVL